MEIEEGQTKVIKQFVNKVSILETTSSLANLIAPHVSLFAFSDLLSLPNFLQPQGAEDSAYLDFLCLFAYGTWYDYKIGVPMRQPLLATFRLATSDSVPPLIEEKIVWASTMCQSDMDHQQELQGRIYEAKKDINFKEHTAQDSGLLKKLSRNKKGKPQGLLSQRLRIQITTEKSKKTLTKEEEDPIRSKRRRSQHTYSRGRPVYP